MSSAVFPIPRSNTGTLPGVTWNIGRRPQFSNKLQTAIGGRETTYAFWPYPKYHWTLEYEFLRSYTPSGGSPYTEWQILEEFFKARQGSFDTFLFDDPNDDTATTQVFGTGDGSTVAFQLARTLTTGGFSEPVYNVYGAAFTGSPLIYKNGVLQTGGGVDYTLGSTGLVTFTAAPANGLSLTWTGTWRWRARFESDESQFELFAQNFWRNRQVQIRSVLGS